MIINNEVQHVIFVVKSLRITLLSNDPNTSQLNHLKAMTNVPPKQMRTTELHNMHVDIKRKII